jgi:PHP family Zn ribbon phosphoesterase
LKIDLHLHSPASKCFKDDNLPDTAERMAQKALDEGLNIIGVTDHHSVDFIPDIQKAAKGLSLIVLPGVELSFAVGDFKNIYLLAYFPENTPRAELDRIFDEWKIPYAAKGDCNYRMETGIDRVISDVRRYGGIIISGHADKNNARKRAIPVLINDYGIKLFDFKYSATAEEIQKRLSCTICGFTFSDSHRIADIGSRYSQIDLDRGIFHKLANLLRDGKTR